MDPITYYIICKVFTKDIVDIIVYHDRINNANNKSQLFKKLLSSLHNIHSDSINPYYSNPHNEKSHHIYFFYREDNFMMKKFTFYDIRQAEQIFTMPLSYIIEFSKKGLYDSKIRMKHDLLCSKKISS